LNGAWGIAGGALTLVGVIVTGWFTYRGARAAAAAQAAPLARAQEFAVLQATVERVDKENVELRTRQSKLEAALRAFSRTADRWARQMERAGVTPEPPDPLVDEYNRTGV
jgi:type VI protein secretion system component VasK